MRIPRVSVPAEKNEQHPCVTRFFSRATEIGPDGFGHDFYRPVELFNGQVKLALLMERDPAIAMGSGECRLLIRLQGSDVSGVVYHFSSPSLSGNFLCGNAIKTILQQHVTVMPTEHARASSATASFLEMRRRMPINNCWLLSAK